MTNLATGQHRLCVWHACCIVGLANHPSILAVQVTNNSETTSKAETYKEILDNGRRYQNVRDES